MSNQIESNTFAAACYEQNSIEDLRGCSLADADETDMKEWNITPAEWVKSIQAALESLVMDSIHESVDLLEDDFNAAYQQLKELADVSYEGNDNITLFLFGIGEHQQIVVSIDSDGIYVISRH